MKRVLLVNPPIYDFSAYDFWLRPFGLLRAAGFFRDRAEFRFFDFLDRSQGSGSGDPWGRGKYPSEIVDTPGPLASIERPYRRYGLTLERFLDFLESECPFDLALVETSMTYWYPGVREVIRTLRDCGHRGPIVLGGVYASLCPDHARSLGGDLVVEGAGLSPLAPLLESDPDFSRPPLWELYEGLEAAVVKLSDGCPFRCTYCSVPRLFSGFQIRCFEPVIRSLRDLHERKVPNIVFYDDALLFRPEEMLLSFLARVEKEGLDFHFHTPNALNARFLTEDLARRMVNGGFQTFYLGFESHSSDWQRQTGSKVYSQELIRAAEALFRAGVSSEQITCYLILGHPHGESQELLESMKFVHSLGLNIMLSEFSPIPGTEDGEACRRWVDLDEPLMHNKVAFTHLTLGSEMLQELKERCRELNGRLATGG